MNDYHNILVAIDFSDASHAVITRANDIAHRNNTSLTVLHVVEYLPPMDMAYEPVTSIAWIDEEAMLKRATTTLAKICKEHQPNEHQPNEHQLRDAQQIVKLGMAKNEICQYARQHQCDLVILGSHGRHGIQLLLGSTANGVLHDMPCDVLAVKLTK